MESMQAQVTTQRQTVGALLRAYATWQLDRNATREKCLENMRPIIDALVKDGKCNANMYDHIADHVAGYRFAVGLTTSQKHTLAVLVSAADHTVAATESLNDALTQVEKDLFSEYRLAQQQLAAVEQKLFAQLKPVVQTTVEAVFAKQGERFDPEFVTSIQFNTPKLRGPLWNRQP